MKKTLIKVVAGTMAFVCILSLFSCGHEKETVEMARYMNVDAKYTKTAPRIDKSDAEGNLFIYLVLYDLQDVRERLWDTYDAIFELHNNHASPYEFEDYRYNGGGTFGGFSDALDGCFMWRCEDTYHGDYEHSAYLQNYAGYLYDCYEIVDRCPRYLDSIWNCLYDLSMTGDDYASASLKENIVEFKKAMYLFRQAIETLEPVKDWFWEWGA